MINTVMGWFFFFISQHSSAHWLHYTQCSGMLWWRCCSPLWLQGCEPSCLDKCWSFSASCTRAACGSEVEDQGKPCVREPKRDDPFQQHCIARHFSLVQVYHQVIHIKAYSVLLSCTETNSKNVFKGLSLYTPYTVYLLYLYASPYIQINPWAWKWFP